MCCADGDNSVKTLVVHVILLITVTWRGIDESTKTPFFPPLFIKKKKNEEAIREVNFSFLHVNVSADTGL